jgi:copper homeostasis protein
MNYKVEICTDSILSSVVARNAGADRIELCDNLLEGGTTPGYGTILHARKITGIVMNVLIRPRGGDFLYSSDEFWIMKKDIELCKKCGVDGVVSGILNSDGTIDVERSSELVRLARPMSFTFHRAFDMCIDPLQGLEDIILTGADRILTSGQQNSAAKGADLISSLVKLSAERIIIMPGGGISEENIASIAQTTRAAEFHMSARRKTDSSMIYRKPEVTMGSMPGYDEYSVRIADEQKIKRIITILETL